MKNTLELLAPAGDLKTLKAVIDAGADAVYFGGSMFGARAYASNFSIEEALEAVEYGHIHDRKIFLTVNTLLKNEEITQHLYEYLLPYYTKGLDAVIVQDYGVMQFIRTYFPDLPIHTSTQMTVTGVAGAKFLADQGAKRIVMAREVSCKEIAAIHEQVPVELESFVHGALCYSYSGACLFSSLLGGRSGNRGRCAQPCRLPYEVSDSEHHLVKQQGLYPLSPKDLCTIEEIPYLAEAGVYSFKIEGRMKQTEYAAGVVSVYRNYIDKYLSQGKDSFAVSKEDIEKLLNLGNRSGFTKGCYHNWNSKDMISFEKPNHRKSDAVLETNISESKNNQDNKEKINGFLSVKKDLPVTLTLFWKDISVEVTGTVPMEANKQPLTKEVLLEKMQKTGNTPFVFETLEIDCAEGLFLPVQKINEIRREALEELVKEKCKEYHRSSPTTPNLTDREKETSVSVKKEEFLLSVSIEEKAQLLPLLLEPKIFRIYVDSTLFSKDTIDAEMNEVLKQIKSAGKEAYYILPSVFRYNTQQFYQNLPELFLWDGYLVKNYDSLGFLLSKDISPEKIRADHCLYTYSNKAKVAFLNLGLQGDTLPLELNQKELRHRNLTKSEMIVYGYLPLMTSVHCVHKNLLGCDKKRQIHYLKDRLSVEFPVKNHCQECYNTIYNSKPLCLFRFFDTIAGMGISSIRLSFTTETTEQVQKITSLCVKAQLGQQEFDFTYDSNEITYGHFKRGVE